MLQDSQELRRIKSKWKGILAMAIRLTASVPKTGLGTNQRVYIEGWCHSSDTKPTDGIAGGSSLIEYDTGDWYIFNENTETWGKMRTIKE